MRKSDFTLPTLDDLFSTQAERDDAKLERVRNIPLAELHPFKGHPFKVQNNEEMQRMIESIRKVGAITPALARPLPDGGYELISGHRRLAACQGLGVETMPVIVRELSDDEAVIAMVDANLQRETILPSEKAFAYKMKLDAIKHQGVTSAQVGQKLLSVEKVADDAGESRNQIKRYIRLTYLILGTSIMTLTTTPNQLTDGLEKALSPLKYIKVPVHEIAMMMSIALRFIPILIEETDKIMKAQMARGADFENGSLIKRAKAMVPILVPLFVSAFRRANELAMAMEARCYHGSEGRTKMKPLKYEKRDRIAYISMVLYLGVIIIVKIIAA